MKRILITGLALCLCLALFACGEKDAGPPMQGVSWAEGVEYAEAFEPQSDPGDNMSAEDAAKALFSALIYLDDDFYTPGDAVAITLTGLDTVSGRDAYLYTVKTSEGESKHAVNYLGNVYALRGGAYTLIYGDEALGGVENAEQAEAVVSGLLRAQMDEGCALKAEGEGEIGGRRAFLFALGKNSQVKFTAEFHYGVTDIGEFWLLDPIENEWYPAAAG